MQFQFSGLDPGPRLKSFVITRFARSQPTGPCRTETRIAVSNPLIRKEPQLLSLLEATGLSWLTKLDPLLAVGSKRIEATTARSNTAATEKVAPLGEDMCASQSCSAAYGNQLRDY
jgi:hypothetical protein